MLFFFPQSKAIETTTKPQSIPISLSIDSLTLPERALPNETVEKFLERLSISHTKDDTLTPNPETVLSANTTVTIETAKHYSITTKTGKKEGVTTLHTVEQLLNEQRVSLGKNDLVTPEPEKALTDGIKISVIKVDIREEILKKPLPFETKETEDSTLSWRKRLITQKGDKGIRELTYEVISHDGKEIKRTLKESTVTKEPVTEIATQGTKVEVGKSHAGLGSWYSFTGTLSAANPWLPLGSYVRVTNTDNGKSVIVRINDRGPFGKNRIIDLDKVAFKEIASLGAGIIPVKVEEITN
ncbi:MAG: G5 domain-containing protein [Candidatus Moraniibacteriota bacterium]|nr:MAG: G5 domain-containing protein [Candidatus Moranbacteria bacterium]